MAKNKVYIDVVVDDKGTTKRVAVNAKKLGAALEDTGKSARTADRLPALFQCLRTAPRSRIALFRRDFHIRAPDARWPSARCFWRWTADARFCLRARCRRRQYAGLPSRTRAGASLQYW